MGLLNSVAGTRRTFSRAPQPSRWAPRNCKYRVRKIICESWRSTCCVRGPGERYGSVTSPPPLNRDPKTLIGTFVLVETNAGLTGWDAPSLWRASYLG